MKKQPDSFLEFNGRRLSVLSKDGQWWVAIKPICEALDVQYNRAFANVKEDEILGQLLAEQLIVAADGKLRNMTCLPEKFIYGWLFSIRSESQALADYKRQCYEVLYNHFHSTLTVRVSALQEKSAIDLEIETLEQELLESPQYLKIQELKKRKTAANARLRQLDQDLVARLSCPPSSRYHF